MMANNTKLMNYIHTQLNRKLKEARPPKLCGGQVWDLDTKLIVLLPLVVGRRYVGARILLNEYGQPVVDMGKDLLEYECVGDIRGDYVGTFTSCLMPIDTSEVNK